MLCTGSILVGWLELEAWVGAGREANLGCSWGGLELQASVLELTEAAI